MEYMSGVVTVMVADLDSAIGFYTKTLGLELKVHFESAWAEVGVEGLTIGLHPAPKESAGQRREGFALGLQVDDLDAAMAELRGRGVKFGYEADTGIIRRANFDDPDGNHLYLVEVRPR